MKRTQQNLSLLFFASFLILSFCGFSARADYARLWCTGVGNKYSYSTQTTIFLRSLANSDPNWATFQLQTADAPNLGIESVWAEVGSSYWVVTPFDSYVFVDDPVGGMSTLTNKDTAHVIALGREIGHYTYTLDAWVYGKPTSEISIPERDPEHHSMNIDVSYLGAIVSFDPSPIVTGLTFLGKKSDGTVGEITPGRRVTATVVPPSAVGNINIVVQGENRIALSDWAQDASLGTKSFNVTGTSATPSDQPNGDTILVAVDSSAGSVECGRANAILVKPVSVEWVNDSGIEAANFLWDADSCPAYWDPLPTGFTYRATWYGCKQTIHVKDQFGKALGWAYTDAVVQEYGVNINQYLSSTGTYLDYVNETVWLEPPVPKTSQAAIQWSGGAPKLVLNRPNGTDSASVSDLKIGGFPISGGISGRLIDWDTDASGVVTVRVHGVQ